MFYYSNEKYKVFFDSNVLLVNGVDCALMLAMVARIGILSYKQKIWILNPAAIALFTHAIL
jgi:hypothetical protein